ncbi:MAG: C-terminal binding protein, partial [Spirochaetaceae bacterium]
MTSRSRYKAVILDNVFKDYDIEEEILRQAGCTLAVADPESESEMISLVSDADAVIVNLHQINENVISTMIKCRIISRYGVGFDNVDIAAAARFGIWVSNVPDYCIEETSDHAIALLASCARNISRKDRCIRNGKWKMEHGCQSLRIAGKTLGIIGYGKVGRAVHRKLSGWDLDHVLVHDPYIKAEELSGKHVRIVPLQTLIRESDFITIHTPLTPETHHLIGRHELAMMKKTAIIINTARGKIIDEAALVEALASGKIMGAGLDVYETEPLPGNSPLCATENVVLTNHTAYHSGESEIELKTLSALNVAETLCNGKPMYPVNSVAIPACGKM